jgi:hypothetical protein
MTYGYGEPGSPPPDGEPDEWNQYRQPRPASRDGYPPAVPHQGGPGYGGASTYGEPAYGEQGYRDSGYGAPSSGPAYGGSTYGTPSSGAAYGGRSDGYDHRDQGYNDGYGDSGYGGPADGRRPAPQSRPPQPGYGQTYGQPQQPPGQTYGQPSYHQPGYPDPNYPPAGRGNAPGPGPSTYQASGYPAAPSAPPRGGQTYGGGGDGWNDGRGGQPGYGQAYGQQQPPGQTYGQQQPYGGQTYGQPGYGAPGGYPPPDGRRPGSMDYGRPGSEPPDEPDEPAKSRRGGKVLVALLTLAVVAAIGVFGYKYFLEKPAANTPGAVSSTPAVLPSSDPILSQKTDAKPLTAAEVFGDASIRSSATGGNYTMVKSQAITGCADIATAKIQALLTAQGCTQVVRANLTSPDGRYTITAGILNMPDEKSAANVRTSINALVQGGKDHFNVYAPATTASTAPQPTTHLGWDSRGHYVFYVVIALASGQPIGTTDTRTGLIISDIVETYLSGKVIGAREKAPATASK